MMKRREHRCCCCRCGAAVAGGVSEVGAEGAGGGRRRWLVGTHPLDGRGAEGQGVAQRLPAVLDVGDEGVAQACAVRGGNMGARGRTHMRAMW